MEIGSAEREWKGRQCFCWLAWLDVERRVSEVGVLREEKGSVVIGAWLRIVWMAGAGEGIEKFGQGGLGNGGCFSLLIRCNKSLWPLS